MHVRLGGAVVHRMIDGAQGSFRVQGMPCTCDWGGALCRMIGGALSFGRHCMAPFLYFAQCAGFAVNNRLASHRRQRRIVLRWDEWQSQCARGCRRGCGLIATISAIVAGGQFVCGSWLRDDSIHNRFSCIQGTQKIVSACWFACQ